MAVSRELTAGINIRVEHASLVHDPHPILKPFETLPSHTVTPPVVFYLEHSLLLLDPVRNEWPVLRVRLKQVNSVTNVVFGELEHAVDNVALEVGVDLTWWQGPTTAPRYKEEAWRSVSKDEEKVVDFIVENRHVYRDLYQQYRVHPRSLWVETVYYTWEKTLLFPAPMALGLPEALLPLSLLARPLTRVIHEHTGIKPKWVPGTRGAAPPAPKRGVNRRLSRELESALAPQLPSYGRVTVAAYPEDLPYLMHVVITLHPEWKRVPPFYEPWVRRVLGQVEASLRRGPEVSPGEEGREGVLEPAPPYEGELGRPLPIVMQQTLGWNPEVHPLDRLASDVLRGLYPPGTRIRARPTPAPGGRPPDLGHPQRA